MLVRSTRLGEARWGAGEGAWKGCGRGVKGAGKDARKEARRWVEGEKAIRVVKY